jgi:hypothetical protein
VEGRTNRPAVIHRRTAESVWLWRHLRVGPASAEHQSAASHRTGRLFGHYSSHTRDHVIPCRWSVGSEGLLNRYR